MRLDYNIILNQLTKQKKQREMQSMIDNARKQGADIDMEYDAESGQFIPHIKYKRQSKSEQLEDMLKVQKMIMDVSKGEMDIKKGEREETQAQQGEEFNWLSELGFGGGAQRLQREGVSGQVKPDIKRALEMRNKFRGTGQTLLPTEKGWTRSKLPTSKKPAKPTLTETFRNDFQDLISILGQIDTLPTDRRDKAIRKNEAKKMFLDEYPDKALTMQDYFTNIKQLR